MSPRLSPFPLGTGSTALTDGFTAWQSDPDWVISGDAPLTEEWGGPDKILLSTEQLFFWENNPGAEQDPFLRSTKATKVYTEDANGVPLGRNKYYLVTVDVVWKLGSFIDFNVARVGMWVNDVFFAPAAGPTGTLVAPTVPMTGYGMTNADGELTIAFGITDVHPSFNLNIEFENLRFTTPSAELADIYYDAGVCYVNGNPISVTRDGIQFDPQEVIEDYDFAGKTAPVEGCDEVVETRPVMRTRFMLTGEYQFSIYRPDGTWADGTLEGERVYTPAAARAALASGLYIEFVAIWPRQRGDYVGVRFRKALCKMRALGGIDKDENAVDVEIEARIPAGEPTTTVPYEIFTLPSTAESV